MVSSLMVVSIDSLRRKETHASRAIEDETERVTRAASVSHINVEHR